jgi:hypothetical protein
MKPVRFKFFGGRGANGGGGVSCFDNQLTINVIKKKKKYKFEINTRFSGNCDVKSRFHVKSELCSTHSTQNYIVK